MPRIPVLRTLVSISMAAILATAAFGQAKPADELDVSRCWAVPADAPISGLAADGSRVYAASDGARFGAFTVDGKKLWSADFGGEIASNILLTDAYLVLATHAAGEGAESMLRIVSRDTGIVSGTVPLPAAERHLISWVNGAIAVASANGVVQLLDANGQAKWRREIAAAFAGFPAFGRDRMYVASTAKQVFAIHSATGEIESVQKMPFNVTAVGVTPSGGVVVGDERGNLTSLAADGSRNWRFRSGARVTRVAAANGHILALSDDNFVYCLDLSSGRVLWKRRLAGRAAYFANVGASFTITTSLDEHGAVLTGLASGKPAGQLVLGEDEFISADPASAGPLLVIGTNAALYGYSLSGPSNCPK